MCIRDRLEIAKQTLKNSKDPAEREKVQQKYDALLEKDIASDKEVIAACSNGNAGSSACASARLKAVSYTHLWLTGMCHWRRVTMLMFLLPPVQIRPGALRKRRNPV